MDEDSRVNCQKQHGERVRGVPIWFVMTVCFVKRPIVKKK